MEWAQAIPPASLLLTMPSCLVCDYRPAVPQDTVSTVPLVVPEEGPDRGTPAPSQASDRGPRGRPRGRGRGRGRGGRGASRGGSSSQPPPASASMVMSEDEELELTRESKVFHTITYGKEACSCAVLWKIMC